MPSLARQKWCFYFSFLLYQFIVRQANYVLRDVDPKLKLMYYVDPRLNRHVR